MCQFSPVKVLWPQKDDIFNGIKDIFKRIEDIIKIKHIFRGN